MLIILMQVTAYEDTKKQVHNNIIGNEKLDINKETNILYYKKEEKQKSSCQGAKRAKSEVAQSVNLVGKQSS